MIKHQTNNTKLSVHLGDLHGNQETQQLGAKVKKHYSTHYPHHALYVLFCSLPSQSGKFAGASADGQDAPGQGLDYAEDAAEHEQMTAVLRNSLQLGDTTPSVLPGLRTRTRANRGASKLNLTQFIAQLIAQFIYFIAIR